MLKKLIACLLATTALQGALAAQLPEVTVYKDPDCGCCTEWVKHMQESGFQVKQVNTRAMDAERQRFGVPRIWLVAIPRKLAATPWKAMSPPPPSRKCWPKSRRYEA